MIVPLVKNARKKFHKENKNSNKPKLIGLKSEYVDFFKPFYESHVCFRLQNTLKSLWKPLRNDQLVEGENYFLIPNTWLQTWKEYVTKPMLPKPPDIGE